MNIKEMPSVDRPYEKCLRYGTGALSDAELLAVVLRTGSKGCDALDLAGRILLKDNGGLLNLHDMSISELCSFEGVGRVKAVQMKCIARISERIASSVRSKGVSLDSPGKVADYYMERLRHEKKEVLLLCMMDIRSHIIADEVISVGSATASVAGPREVFMAALNHGAVSMIMLHNHPSGDPAPSSADIEVTERIAYVGRMLEIPLNDHIIIGDNCYYSFREEKKLGSI